MNIRKFLVLATAIAINVLVLAWFHSWTAAAIASATPPASNDAIVTLPAINVHPSAAQIQQLRRERAAGVASAAAKRA